MEAVQLSTLTHEEREALLEVLGYGTDGTFVLNGDGSPYHDPYTSKPVRVANMLVVPGSILVLDNDDLSIALYLEHHRELSNA